MSRAFRRALPVALTAFASALLAAEPDIRFPLADLAGKVHALGKNEAWRVRVFVFLGTECPVSQSCIPELNRLAQRFSGKSQGAEIFGVLSDPSLAPAAAARHFAEWKAEFPVLRDAAGKLARALRPVAVPEAFVLDRGGRLIYRGAIDDAWQEIGRRRPQVERHFLSDALAATLAGRAPTVAQTTAVGCIFEMPPRADAAKP